MNTLRHVEVIQYLLATTLFGTLSQVTVSKLGKLVEVCVSCHCTSWNITRRNDTSGVAMTPVQTVLSDTLTD